jgi:hypothetical protein
MTISIVRNSDEMSILDGGSKRPVKHSRKDHKLQHDNQPSYGFPKQSAEISIIIITNSLHWIEPILSFQGHLICLKYKFIK